MIIIRIARIIVQLNMRKQILRQVTNFVKRFAKLSTTRYDCFI